FQLPGVPPPSTTCCTCSTPPLIASEPVYVVPPVVLPTCTLVACTVPASICSVPVLALPTTTVSSTSSVPPLTCTFSPATSPLPPMSNWYATGVVVVTVTSPSVPAPWPTTDATSYVLGMAAFHLAAVFHSPPLEFHTRV